MGPLSFDQSGGGPVAVGPLTLTEVQQLCVDCGFAKAGVDASKPLALRADTAELFKVLGVNSLSAFRELFYNSRVQQPKPGQAPPPPAPKKQASAAAPAVRASRSLCTRMKRITTAALNHACCAAAPRALRADASAPHRSRRARSRRTPCRT